MGSTNLDLNNITFLTGSSFVFGSWISKVDSNGKLRSYLLEDLKNSETPEKTTERLSKKMMLLMISAKAKEDEWSKLSSFPSGLNISAATNQKLL